ALQPPDATDVRARLLAALAVELTWTTENERARALSDEAVRLARTCRDPRVLARVLARHRLATAGPGDPTARFAVADERVVLGEKLEEPDTVLDGLGARFDALVELGEIAAATDTINSYAGIAENEGLRLHGYSAIWCGLALALFAGRFEGAEPII